MIKLRISPITLLVFSVVPVAGCGKNEDSPSTAAMPGFDDSDPASMVDFQSTARVALDRHPFLPSSNQHSGTRIHLGDRRALENLFRSLRRKRLLQR